MMPPDSQPRVDEQQRRQILLTRRAQHHVIRAKDADGHAVTMGVLDSAQGIAEQGGQPQFSQPTGARHHCSQRSSARRQKLNANGAVQAQVGAGLDPGHWHHRGMLQPPPPIGYRQRCLHGQFGHSDLLDQQRRLA